MRLQKFLSSLGLQSSLGGSQECRNLQPLSSKGHLWNRHRPNLIVAPNFLNYCPTEWQLEKWYSSSFCDNASVKALVAEDDEALNYAKKMVMQFTLTAEEIS